MKIANSNHLILESSKELTAAGIDTAYLDARILLEHATGYSKEKILLGRFEISQEQEHKFAELIARRKNREPVSHIIETREFFGLEFKVNADVLDPRPDSETLIEAVCELFPNRSLPLKIIDFGTGSGCLLLSLLQEFKAATGLGVDISEQALILASANSAALGFTHRAEFIESCWGEGISDRFDLVISNPPYIKKQEIETLAPEVALYEPRLALDGGFDGLDCYRQLMPHIARILNRRGYAVIEIGEGQEKELTEIINRVGLTVHHIRKDLAGIERCLVLSKV